MNKNFIKRYLINDFIPSILGFGTGIILWALIISPKYLHDTGYWITQGILFSFLNIYYFFKRKNEN